VPLIDSTKITVALDGTLTVTAGHTADHRLIVGNDSRLGFRAACSAHRRSLTVGAVRNSLELMPCVSL
jgi:hypothetical protein